ncbi:hypothetical protein BJ170DRAFT_315827 [Xylariales sp. AK1849]|nr:hypothetical protein BJ170DRAFT_315827 [Xylariales sp. AK1849]
MISAEQRCGIGSALLAQVLHQHRHHRRRRRQLRHLRLHFPALLLQRISLLSNSGGFDDTCTIVPAGAGDHHNTNGAWITAGCASRNGRRYRSSLDLNHCLENRSGQLTGREDGNFMASCGGLRLERESGYKLHAICVVHDYFPLPREQLRAHTTFPLRAVISNDNGRLRCWKHAGTNCH